MSCITNSVKGKMHRKMNKWLMVYPVALRVIAVLYFCRK